ncbi:hppA1 [Symbiodinium sp. KB8]|nr:hppA1 [Symbiodinium sp. KB8]
MLIATAANARTTLACVDSMTEGLKVSFASGAVMANSVVGMGILGVSIMYGIFEHMSIDGNDRSFVSSIIAAGTLATNDAEVAFPFWCAGFGVLLSLFGVAYVRCQHLDPATTTLSSLLGVIRGGIMVWGCTLIGLVSGEIIGNFTEYVTSYEDAPTRGISNAGKFGHAPVVIKGLGVGMLSVIVPTLAIGITVIACNEIAGLYGIAVSAVGMLSTLGVTLATDAYGPVADNMAELPDTVRDKTDKLDSLGNTTAATGKGFAIGSAVLTSVALIVSYLQLAGLTAAQVGVSQPTVMIGALIGAMLPFVFAALTMLSVDRAARAIISEVRLQFAQAPALVQQAWQTEDEYEAALEQKRAEFRAKLAAENPDEEHMNRISGNDGKAYPDSNRCVAIATQSAIYEMVLPGGAAIFVPVIIGYLLGAAALGGLLIGSLTSGFMLALTMSNAGGAWDNAKKWVEKCGSEGEEITADDEVKPIGSFNIKWTTYGVKKADKARGLLQTYAEGGALSLVTNRNPGDLEATTGFAAGNTEWEAWKRETAEELATFFKSRKDPVVSGDTVGDPFKDTSGPALNILIKLTSIVSLVLAPTLRTRQNAFEEDSWWIAIIVLVVTGILAFVSTSQINAAFSKSEAEAEEKLATARANAAALRASGAAAPVVAADAGDVQVDAEAAPAPAAAADAEEEKTADAAEPAEETTEAAADAEATEEGDKDE